MDNHFRELKELYAQFNSRNSSKPMEAQKKLGELKSQRPEKAGHSPKNLDECKKKAPTPQLSVCKISAYRAPSGARTPDK